MNDNPARRHSPAAERNQKPILDVLRRVLPARGVALEVASGTGQHVTHFAANLPAWIWQPTDADPQALASIDAWRMSSRLANVRPAVPLDVMAPSWVGGAIFDAIYCANMLHIAPWPTCLALMCGAARQLAPNGVLVTYGPYLLTGLPDAPGNLAFDADLRARNAAWGIRRIEDVQQEAGRAGLELLERVAMPANNYSLVFARRGVTLGDAPTGAMR